MKKVHFVGVGGSGTSALAQFFLSEKWEVSGSDRDDSMILEKLKSRGAKIFVGHRAENLPENLDLLVFSTAIDEGNPERAAAEKLQIPQKSYFQTLGEISRKFKTIAVAGTHGKSTTTAMISTATAAANLDPTVFVGTRVFEFDNLNFRAGNSEFLIAEACEHFRSFLNFRPEILVITNVEADHLDFYKTEENYEAAFEKLILQSKVLVADFSDLKIQKVARDFRGKKISTENFSPPKLQFPGKHNLQNAQKVFGVFVALNLPAEIAEKSLRNFRGTFRRFEFLGEKNGVKIFDDYAHHPTEVRATLAAAREKFPREKIWAIFQPHQFSRTKFFWNEFAASFENADEILIPPIFASRDDPKNFPEITPEKFAEKIRAENKNCRAVLNFAAAVKILKNEIRGGEILISIGAGNVREIAEKFLEKE